jgi:dTDP-4-amino-4,6-dideoxy-D-glucose transaminase
MFDNPYELVSPLLPDAQTLFPDVRAALASKRLTHGGPFVLRLQRRLEEVLDVPHVVATSSATVGLMVAIRALGWRGEVITPSFNFAGTVHAIAWAGGTPVLGEVDRDSFTLDPSSVERLLGPRTSAILPVDTYGVPADLDALAEVAGDVPILVDAAHSLGSEFVARAHPRARVFSMHPTKTLVAGEGGLVATSDRDLAQRVSSLSNFGFGNDQDAFDVGLNAKLPELSAILAYHQIDLLPRTIEGRRAWDHAYREVLQAVPGITFQSQPEGIKTNRQYTSIIIDEPSFGRSRDQVASELRRRNIVTRPYFSPPVHNMTVYRSRLRSDDLRWTERLSGSVLCLPVHPGETPDRAVEIADLIRSLRTA